MVTGWKFSMYKQLFFLCNRATKAFSKSFGNSEFLFVKFIMLVTGFTTVFLANLRFFVEIPSHPVAHFIYLLTYKLFLKRFKFKKHDYCKIFNILGWFSFTDIEISPIFWLHLQKCKLQEKTVFLLLKWPHFQVWKITEKNDSLFSLF